MRINKLLVPVLAAFIFLSAVSWQAIRITASMEGDGTTANPLGIAANGITARELESSGVTPDSYTNASITVDEDGRITSASSGVGSGASSSHYVISPAQITSDQDNYAPTGIGKATYLLVSGDSDIHAITGIADSTAGALRKTVVNTGSYTIYFLSEHPDSDAAHRFTGLSSDFKLYPGKSCDIFRDVSASRWRILSAEDENGRTGVFYEVSAGNASAGDWGDLAFTAIGSGTITTASSTTTVPASFRLSTSTNAAWGHILYFPKGSATTYSAFASSHMYAEAIISIPTLSDGSETFTSELQITATPTSTSLEVNNSIGIRYSHGINGGEWELFSQDNAAGEDVADSGVAVAAATLYKLRIEIDKSKTEARGYVNDVYIGKVESNMPNSVVVGARVIHLKSVGASARFLDVHSFSAGAIYK